ncbi:MAG TPA: M48 family peptidase, partial [Gammaproteobacteria bacterium]|nr:M48 family peptidase [Gammaproteobacteria bacterium]
ADETGQDGAAHYYLAEHYLQEDRPQDAALQLRLALADGDLSELERARATLRLEELERRAD